MHASAAALPAALALVSPHVSAQSDGSAQTDGFAGQTLDAGVGLWALETGDMNGDGLLDVVTAARGTNDISVLLALPGGGLAPKQTVNASSTTDVVLLDVDLDGALDVVQSYSGLIGQQNMRHFQGGGDGSLSLFQVLDASGKPQHLATGDLDADGEFDLVTFSDDNAVDVAFGAPGPSFGSYVSAGSFFSARSIAVADTTGDGVADLAVGEMAGQIVILSGSGPGVLSTVATLNGAPDPLTLSLEDANSDGLADVLTGCANVPAVQPPTDTLVGVHFALGGSTWASELRLDLDQRPMKVHAGDYDGDGLGDLLVVELTGYVAFRGTGVDFERAGAWVGGGFASTYYDARDCGLLDVDQDGDLDLLGADVDLHLYPNDGTRFTGPQRWSAGPFWPSSGDPLSRSLAVLDLNGDALPEVVLYVGESLLSVVEQDLEGLPQTPQPYVSASEVTAVVGARLNADERSDVIAVSSDPPAAHVQLATSGGGLAAISDTVDLPGPLSSWTQALSADLNGDGFGDVAVTQQSTVAILTSDGSGLELATEVPDNGPTVRVLDLGDLNNDGHVDLFLNGTDYPFYPFGGYSYSDMRWATHLGDGAGGFALAASGTSLDMDALDAQLVDWSGDGQLDLIAMGEYLPGSTPTKPRMRIFTGDGAGGLLFDQNVVPPAPAIDQVWVADLDGDGEQDLLSSGGSAIALQRGAGGGQLEPAEFSYAGNGWGKSQLADMNGDGWMDLVRVRYGEVATYDLPQVSVNLRVGTAFVGSSNYGAGSSSCRGALGLAANQTPSIGTPDFALLASEVPAGAPGFGYMASGADFVGTDPLGLGLPLHLDLLSGPLFAIVPSNEGLGIGRVPLPIPDAPNLINEVLYAQTFWLAPAPQACWSGLFGLQSSRGLRLVIQP